MLPSSLLCVFKSDSAKLMVSGAYVRVNAVVSVRYI